MGWVSLFQSSPVSSASDSFCCLSVGGLLSLDPLNVDTLSNELILVLKLLLAKRGLLLLGILWKSTCFIWDLGLSS